MTLKKGPKREKCPLFSLASPRAGAWAHRHRRALRAGAAVTLAAALTHRHKRSRT